MSAQQAQIDLIVVVHGWTQHKEQHYIMQWPPM